MTGKKGNGEGSDGDTSAEVSGVSEMSQVDLSVTIEHERPSTPVAPRDRSYASLVSCQSTPTSPQLQTPRMDGNDRVRQKNSSLNSEILQT